MENHQQDDLKNSRESLTKFVKQLEKETMKRFVETERPKLTMEQILRGQKLCSENAKSLIDEAKFLYKNRYFARSFCLIVLTFEELEKISRLTEALFIDQNDDKRWDKFWKLFRHHLFKLHGFYLFNFVSQFWNDFSKGIKKSEEEWIKELIVGPKWLYWMKLRGFYVDFIDGQFVLPLNKDFEEHCKKYLPIAETYLEYSKGYVFKNVEDAKRFIETWKKLGLPRNSEEALEHLKKFSAI